MKRREKLYDISDVCDYYGLSESTIRRKVRESRDGNGNFPLPLFKSGCKVLWRKSDIESWRGEESEVIHFAPTTSATPETSLNLTETHKRLARFGISIPQTTEPQSRGTG